VSALSQSDIPRCPHCGAFAFLESLACAICASPLGIHVPTLTFVLASPEGTEVDGETWHECANRPAGCNWLVAAADDSPRCFACRLTRRLPDASDALAWERLPETDSAKRRLLVQLMRLGLPITPFWEREGGLGFDLVSSFGGEPVVIGHADGIITIDLAESLDDRREALRVKLGEPYRTMLGHFRHEVGHYYEQVLVTDEPLLGECRALFGDERASYQEAIDRHYAEGAPDGWQDEFISEYATMHPWEDFAETFAHYLHITGTLQTTAATGLVLDAERASGYVADDIVPLADYRDESLERMLSDWRSLSLVFNRINRSMGLRDLYPFVLPEPVVRKLGFVHRLVTEVGRGAPAAPAAL